MLLGKHWPAQQFLDVVSAPYCRVHFSQFGEDCMLGELFEFRPGGFYVDVGCHDPYRFSNTYLLWKVLGWKGINIDADARAIERFRAARPQDINLNVGVGPEDGETLQFTTFQDGAVNTFDHALALAQQHQFGEPSVVAVQLRTLRGILDEHLPTGVEVDYLNVDCEGLDEAVLRSNDWIRHRPKVISAELHGLKLDRATDNEIVKFLGTVGYRLISYHWVTGTFLRIA